jgi:hypothetical protein
VHRDFCEVAIADGGRTRSAGRVASTSEQLDLFAQRLAPDARVVLEATGTRSRIARILEPAKRPSLSQPDSVDRFVKRIEAVHFPAQLFVAHAGEPGSGSVWDRWGSVVG